MGKTKVLLIEPPPVSQYGELRTLGSIGSMKADIKWPPLDLMIIAGLLRMKGISVKIIDSNSLRMSFSDIKEIVSRERPEFIVFTTSTPTIFHDIQLADLIKKVSKSIYTGMTSTHINALPKEPFEISKNIDFAFPQESELAILQLVQSGYSPEQVKGVVYKRNNEIVQNGDPMICENLDELGIPAHDIVPLRVYRDPFTQDRPITATYASRGCINNPPCIMCSACFYNNYRYRSVEILIEEMLFLKELGVKELRFPFDSGFNNAEIAVELFDRMIKEKVNLKFTCNARADRLPLELIKKMKEAGCKVICIGCESANREVLKFMRKNERIEQIRETVNNVKKTGIQVLVYFIFGLPLETKETIIETVDFAKKLNADLVTFGIAIPHPGTEFYNYLNGEKYLFTKDWSKYNPLFAPPYSYPDLSSREIYEATRKAYRMYYLRPKTIISRLIKGSLRENILNFVGFLRRY